MSKLNADILEIEALPVFKLNIDNEWTGCLVMLGGVLIMFGFPVIFISLSLDVNLFSVIFENFSIKNIFDSFDAELLIYSIAAVCMVIYICFPSFFQKIKLKMQASRSLTIKKITFSDKGIKIIQQKRNTIFDDFYEYASIDSIFYCKKDKQKDCYRLVVYLKDKTRIETDFCSNDKKIIEKIRHFSKFFGKISEI